MHLWACVDVSVVRKHDAFVADQAHVCTRGIAAERYGTELPTRRWLVNAALRSSVGARIAIGGTWACSLPRTAGDAGARAILVRACSRVWSSTVAESPAGCWRNGILALHDVQEAV